MPSEINEHASMLLRTNEIQKLFKAYDSVGKRQSVRVIRLMP